MTNTEELGLAREEKGGRLHFFREYRVIERGLYSGYIEFRAGKTHGGLMKAPPEGILRWPKDSEPTTKQKLLMDDVKEANLALKNTKKRKGGDG